MNQALGTNQRHYLDSKKFIIAQIAKAKVAWQVTVWEGVIATLFYHKVKNHTNDEWLSVSHCDDLQNLCLLKRCDILAQVYPEFE